MGRSMGTGPAIHLASKFKPNSLILISAYTSIKNVAYEKVSFLSGLVEEQFNNLEAIKTVSNETKVLFIHGKKDSMISSEHSEQLRKALDPSVRSDVSIAENMTHNEYEFFIDLIRPLFQFFLKMKINLNPTKRVQYLPVPEMFYEDHHFRFILNSQKRLK